MELRDHRLLEQRDHRLLIVAMIAAALLVAANTAWFNRNVSPVTWGGTAIIGDRGCLAEMPGIEIGFRHDGIVIWRQAK